MLALLNTVLKFTIYDFPIHLINGQVEMFIFSAKKNSIVSKLDLMINFLIKDDLIK